MKLEWTLILACLLVVGCGETGDVDDVAKSESPASAVANEPVADAAAPKKSAAQMELESLEKKFADARNKFIEDYRALPQEERAKFAETNSPQPNDYADDFMKIADDHPDDPAAFDAVLWIAQSRVSGDQGDKAFSLLLDKHIDNEKLSGVCIGLMYSETSEKAENRLTTLAEKSPHDQVKAMATFALARYFQRAEADESEIIALYETLGSTYGDLKMNERSTQTFAEMAKNSIFEVKNLSVGKVAPDIEGEDLEGVSFKLSDYRGKVVVLDFWGDW